MKVRQGLQRPADRAACPGSRGSDVDATTLAMLKWQTLPGGGGWASGGVGGIGLDVQ